MVGAIGGVSYFLFGIPIGAIVDRWNRGQVLIATAVLRSFFIALIPIGYHFGFLNIWLLIIVLVLTNVLFVASDAANAGALRTLVGPENLLKATSTLSASAAVVDIIVSVCAGWLMVAGNPAVVFLWEAGLLLISAMVLLAIRGRLDTHTAGTESINRGLLDGFRFILANLPVRWTTAGVFALAVSEGIVVGQLVVLFSARFGSTEAPAMVGMGYAAIALGAIAGSILVRFARFDQRPMTITINSLLISALLLFCMLLSPWPQLSFVFLGLWAAPFMLTLVGASALRQSLGPGQLQGRLSIAGRLLTMGSGYPVGQLLGGGIAQFSGVESSYYFAAGFLVLAGITIFTGNKLSTKNGR